MYALEKSAYFQSYLRLSNVFAYGFTNQQALSILAAISRGEEDDRVIESLVGSQPSDEGKYILETACQGLPQVQVSLQVTFYRHSKDNKISVCCDLRMH